MIGSNAAENLVATYSGEWAPDRAMSMIHGYNYTRPLPVHESDYVSWRLHLRRVLRNILFSSQASQASLKWGVGLGRIEHATETLVPQTQASIQLTTVSSFSLSFPYEPGYLVKAYQALCLGKIS